MLELVIGVIGFAVGFLLGVRFELYLDNCTTEEYNEINDAISRGKNRK